MTRRERQGWWIWSAPPQLADVRRRGRRHCDGRELPRTVRSRDFALAGFPPGSRTQDKTGQARHDARRVALTDRQ
jgi:hypothetical protein